MNLRAKVVSSIGLLGLLCLMLPGSLRADTWTYDYTGNPFSYNGSVYPLTGVTGSFTVSSQLAANTTTNLTPETLGGTIISYDFTDGHTTWDMANYMTDAPGTNGAGDPGSQFSVTTDGSGDIVSWFLNIYSNANYPAGGVITTCTSCSNGTGYDDTSVNYNYDGYNFNEPGTWVDPININNTPEPSSLVLLSAGLLALVGMGWRRKQAGQFV